MPTSNPSPDRLLQDEAGPPALSTFALAKIQKQLPAVVYAEYVHVLQLQRAMSPTEQEQALALLNYGPSSGMPIRQGGYLGTVLPRAGTISPWSSKASDIFRLAGLEVVLRVERGVRWYIDVNAEANCIDSQWLFDRMTETFVQEEDFGELFAQASPQPLTLVPLQKEGLAALAAYNAARGLALSDDELAYLAKAYAELGRDPTDVELMMFAQANSEHCRHKIFNANWVIDGVPHGTSLFDKIRNTYNQINGAGILSAYSDNAAVITGHDIARLWVHPDSRDYGYANEPAHILMKVETHNHPTAIAPYAGAATGSGGEIRDEGAVGKGSKPKAGLAGFTTSHLNIPGLEQPWELQTGKPDYMASPLQIMLDGPLGAASFNNEFGRPGINGYFRTFELPDPLAVQSSDPDEMDPALVPIVRGYHKPVMIAGGVGSVREAHVQAEKFPPGTALVVLGGPAMLIGLGGSAASSTASGSGSSDLDFASVQRDNAEMERRCQEVIDSCCALGDANPILLIHDVGAGGLSNALPELIHDAEAGGAIELRDVISADRGMSPLEIWCNESQERYVLGIREEALAQFGAICSLERCPFAVVGRSDRSDHLSVTDADLGVQPVDMPLSVLLGKPPKMTRSFTTETVTLPRLQLAGVELAEALDRVLQFPAVGSKQFLITIGDRSITGMIASQPMLGPWQVPVADAAVTLASFSGYAGEAFAMGERSPLALINPSASARMAVAESLTNLICADLEALERVVLSANWMAAAGENAEEQALFEAVTAVGETFCPALGVAIPVGKDSLSMRTRWQEDGVDRSVVSPLTLIVSAFAPVNDANATVTPVLQPDMDTTLILLHLGGQRLGGSCLAQVYGQMGDVAPDVEDPQALRELLNWVLEAKRAGQVLAMHDRSDGGVLVTLLEMAFAGRLGLDITVPDSDELLDFLFNEEVGLVLQVRNADLADLEAAAPGQWQSLAQLRADEQIVITHQGGACFAGGRGELQQCWARTSHRLQRLRDDEACADEEYAALELDRTQDPGLTAALTFDPSAAFRVNTMSKPAIAILREQGVNGQLEMAAAFDRAGFRCVDVHMSELLDGSRRLNEFQAVAACGGFSYGDVLGAGGGWAKSILFNKAVRDQMQAFLQGDKLVLGICNGCQMLAQLGPLMADAFHWPRFVRNRSEQFEGRTVMIKIAANDSPWLQGMQGSVIPVAVAHGEGRAEFKQRDAWQGLAAAGQVALQYVDAFGELAEVYPLNPNGSPHALAGVTAHEGKVLAMMPHPERVFRSCQNVWRDPAWGEAGPWLRLFQNARRAMD